MAITFTTALAGTGTASAIIVPADVMAQLVKASAGLAGGDEVTVTLEHDTEPRVLDLPEPLAEALNAAGTVEAFRALSYSKQRGLVEPWSAAKTDATRDKNLERILEAARG